MASQKGHARAQYNLAVLYKSGLGVDYDIRLAAQWFEKSANLGFAPAQFNLGSLYLWGKGVEKNPESAKFWLLKAGRQGHSEALTSLGSLYFKGDVLKKNWVRSYAFYKLSSQRGSHRAQSWLTRLEEKMKPAELRQARRMARGDFRDFRWEMGLRTLTSGSAKLAGKAQEIEGFKTLDLETEIGSTTYEMRLFFKEDKLKKILLSAGLPDAKKEYDLTLSKLSQLLNDPGAPASDLDENIDRENRWKISGLFTDTELRLQQTHTRHFFSLFLSHGVRLVYTPF